MKLFVIAVFSSAFILQLQAANYCEHIKDLPKKWAQRHHTQQHSCCEMTDSQWNLIVWYFLRVSSNLNVTQIVRENESCRYERYINHFLRDLFKYTNSEYYMQRIVYRKRDQILQKKHEIQVNTTYQWHAVYEYNVSLETYLTGVPGNHFEVFQSILSKRNCVREDEPRYGSVILALDAQIIDDYLNGPVRYPFESKQSHYIILIYGTFDRKVWHDLSSSIVTKLWKKFGILDAIILASCNPDRVSWVVQCYQLMYQLSVYDLNSIF